jgi:UDP-N-acetylglucosamine diphosphorylase/glucosamine-1-phosphate N-acetyltransferase
MQVVIYEDGREAQFGPLALLRPVFDLRCGALLLREKLELRRPSWRCALLPRAALTAAVAEQYPGRDVGTVGDEPTLLLSGRVVVDDALLSAVEQSEGDALLRADGVSVGAYVTRRVPELLAGGRTTPDLSGLAAAGIECEAIAYPWELVAATGREIEKDAALLEGRGEQRGTVDQGARVLERSRVTLCAGSRIEPGVVLDAREGEIIVGRDAVVMPNAVVIGPAAVGDGTTIKAGARIYGGTSIGPRCKVGGEVEGSVIHSYSNKQHEGFLGHSYLGSWVNLGAATDVSDLKNNYGSVRVHIGGQEVDTGVTFVGATIGDHSKTAIGTKLNTGTVVGIFCNVFPGAFPSKSVPSFSWGTEDGFDVHDIDKALHTARRVMARRDVELTEAQEELIRRVFREVCPAA